MAEGVGSSTLPGELLNPALGLLLLLAALPLAWRRAATRHRTWREAWAVAALAATCGVGGALLHPDGVPSNARLLAAHPPWQEAVQPGGDPHLLDEIHQVEPWLIFLRHEMRAGRLPFWNPHQLSGEPFWSNGSSAPLFPLHVVFVALPLRLGLLLLPWLRLALGGLGAWALARELGVGARPALLAAVAYPLCGPVTAFLLFPMANTHALVPWVLWAVERLASGRGSWTGLAVAGGLQLLGGHPETPALTALLAAIYLVVRRPPEPWRAWLGFTGGWAVAGALSAVHNLPLAATLFESSKWIHWQPPTDVPWGIKAQVLLRLVLPYPHGSAADGTWWGPFNEPATRLYAGAAVLALSAAALPSLRHDTRWRAVAAMGAVALAGAYHLPGAREVLLALPVVSHALHHYLKLGLSLSLVLLAAEGWQRLLHGERRLALTAGSAGIAALLGAATALLLPSWQRHDQDGRQLAWVAGGALAIALIVALARLPSAWRGGLWWAAPALLMLDLGLAHAPGVPAARLSEVYPATRLVERLRTLPGRFAGTGTALRPDAAMVYGLFDVRGDTPVKLERYQRLYASMSEPDPVYFRPIRHWDSPWVDRLGVRWVVGAPRERPPVVGWRRVYDGDDGRIWERPGARPIVRWEDDGASPGPVVLRAEPGRWRLAWRSRRPARLVVAETWDAGWRAEAAGATVAVRPWRGVLMMVDLPAGSGVVTLAYLPRWLPAGSAVSAAAVLAIVATAWRRRHRRRTGPAATSAQIKSELDGGTDPRETHPRAATRATSPPAGRNRS
jgi:hypothetical protein